MLTYNLMNVINAKRYTLQTNLKQNARYKLTKELNNIVYKYTVPVPILGLK